MHIYWVLRGAGVGEDCGYRNLSGWHPCILILPQTHLTSPKLLLLQHGSLWAQVWQGGRTADIACAISPNTCLLFTSSSLSKNVLKKTPRNLPKDCLFFFSPLSFCPSSSAASGDPDGLTLSPSPSPPDLFPTLPPHIHTTENMQQDQGLGTEAKPNKHMRWDISTGKGWAEASGARQCKVCCSVPGRRGGGGRDPLLCPYWGYKMRHQRPLSFILVSS